MSKWYKHESEDGQIYYCVGAEDTSPKAEVLTGSGQPLADKINNYRKNKVNYNYQVGDTDVYVFNHPTSGSELDTLPPGTYVYQEDRYPLPERLVPFEFRDDAFVKTNSNTEILTNVVQTFLSKEDVYRKLNILYKMGILLYGPAGTGKTSLIRNVVKEHIPSDSIVFIINTEDLPSVQFSKVIKDTLKSRLKVFVFEEFTHYTKNPNDMEQILSFLDGEMSLDKSLVFATTNYPEELPGNIVQRPSRFDKLIKIGKPTVEERKLLLNHYLQKEATDEEVRLTDDLTADAIKQVCLLGHLNGLTVKQAVIRINDQIKLAQRDFQEVKKLGI